MKKKQTPLYAYLEKWGKDKRYVKNYISTQYIKPCDTEFLFRQIYPLNRYSERIAIKRANMKYDSKKEGSKVLNYEKKQTKLFKTLEKKEKKKAQNRKRLVRQLLSQGLSKEFITEKIKNYGLQTTRKLFAVNYDLK